MQFEELTTPRLTLRKLTPEVYAYLYGNLSDDELSVFLGLDSQEALQKEKDKYAKGISTYNRSFVNFQLIDKATNKIIGGCGFHTWSPDHNRAEIGYGLFLDEHKGKGLMGEALRAIIPYGFNEMGLWRIEALTSRDNTASLKQLQSFGFTYEGTLREHYNVDGIMEDSVMYSLLKHEFKN